MRKFFATIAVFCLFFNLNCSNGGSTRQLTDDDPPCSTGTVESDGVCVAKHEACNGEDDDGDGRIDEGCLEPQDNPPCAEGTTVKDGQCVPLTNPEECDGLDNDNDGVTDEGCPVPDYDKDNDGFTRWDSDCNDDDFRINPATAEICDGQDNDCDGETDEDDPILDDWCVSTTVINGNPVAVQGTERCHGIAGMICTPLPIEQCQQNEEDCETALDDNCDGQVNEGCSPDLDEDNDGYTRFEGDCNDHNFNINPIAIDHCNGTDNDCDGQFGEDDPDLGLPCTATLYVNDVYVPVQGTYVCGEGGIVCDPPALEDCQLQTEVCGDIYDNNCDGQVNEGCECLSDDDCPASGSCYCHQSGDYICTGLSGLCVNGACETTENVMECELGCHQNGCITDEDEDGFTTPQDCNDNDSEVYPGAQELCDNIDNDCDGETDEECVEQDTPYYCEPHYSQFGTFFGYNGCCGTGFLTADTNHPEPGMLIKAESYNSVFYYASNEMRYVFPLSTVLESWFSPLDENNIPVSPNEELCQQVYEFSDEVVASIPLAGNVTLRPGAFVTGLESPSDRYLVLYCGELAKFEPLTAIDDIYGDSAWSRIKLMPTWLWLNYYEHDHVWVFDSGNVFSWESYYNEADDIEIELGLSGICRDEDNDGFTVYNHDCDDQDEEINPGAEEICDGIDNNCDWEIDVGCENIPVGEGCGGDAQCESDHCTREGSPGYCAVECGPLTNFAECPEGTYCTWSLDSFAGPEYDKWSCQPYPDGATPLCDGLDNDEDGLIDEGCPGVQCIERFDIYFSPDTPTGQLFPTMNTLVAKLTVANSFEDNLMPTLTIKVAVNASSPDDDLEEWRVVDPSTGNELASKVIDISGSETHNEIVFSFNPPLDIQIGYPDQLYIYTDTMELNQMGDAIQLYFNSSCGVEHLGGPLFNP